LLPPSRDEMPMSRVKVSKLSAGGRLGHAGKPMPNDDAAALAEEIGLAALDLAKQAQGAGLHTIGFLLESVALEAGAEAAARRWPANAAER
jgi:hypothetical protein